MQLRETHNRINFNQLLYVICGGQAHKISLYKCFNVREVKRCKKEQVWYTTVAKPPLCEVSEGDGLIMLAT